MANNLDNFINEFNGGNRTHRYDVEMRFPGGGFDDSLNRFFIRAVSLPPSQVNPIRVPYRGRILKWPGDRIYFPWTFRVELNDCWPTIVGPISMDANSIDTLVEFTVTVEYSYHTVKDVN